MLVRIRKFLASDIFLILMAVIATVIICVDQMLGTPVYYGLSIYFGFLCFFVLALSDDMLSMLGPALLMLSFVIQYKNSFDAYMEYLWGIPILVICVILHIVLGHKSFVGLKISSLALFKPICFTCVALFLGGVGSLSLTSYFSTLSVVYMILLGPAVLLLYWYFSSRFASSSDFSFVRLAKIMVVVSCFLIFAIFEYYGEHWAKFIASPNVLPFQWRNNACTLLMIAMPFGFYLSKEKSLWYFLVPVMTCVAFVLSGSRGGLLFGLLEFLILVIYYSVVDSRHRWVYLSVLGIGLALGVVVLIKYSSLVSYTLSRFTSSKENFRRIGLWKRSVSDFLSNPVTGRGIGYMGNRDFHPSQVGQLCWYHSSIPQVIGSMGIVGILAYGYQLVCRFKVLRGLGSAGACALLSLVGLELMSLVNPGIFTPAYLIIITVVMACAERASSNN